MRFFLFLLFALFTTVDHAQSMSTAKAESESLMNAALPFAEEMLQKHGEFFPYGQALDTKGKVVSVAATNGQEHPPSAEIISLLKKAFIEGANSGRYKATALVYDARIQLPSTGAKSDAIAVSLNHRNDYSVVVFFPYRREGEKLVMGEVFANRGDGDVFRK